MSSAPPESSSSSVLPSPPRPAFPPPYNNADDDDDDDPTSNTQHDDGHDDDDDRHDDPPAHVLEAAVANVPAATKKLAVAEIVNIVAKASSQKYIIRGVVAKKFHASMKHVPAGTNLKHLWKVSVAMALKHDAVRLFTVQNTLLLCLPENLAAAKSAATLRFGSKQQRAPMTIPSPSYIMGYQYASPYADPYAASYGAASSAAGFSWPTQEQQMVYIGQLQEALQQRDSTISAMQAAAAQHARKLEEAAGGRAAAIAACKREHEEETRSFKELLKKERTEHDARLAEQAEATAAREKKIEQLEQQLLEQKCAAKQALMQLDEIQAENDEFKATNEELAAALARSEKAASDAVAAAAAAASASESAAAAAEKPPLAAATRRKPPQLLPSQAVFTLVDVVQKMLAKNHGSSNARLPRREVAKRFNSASRTTGQFAATVKDAVALDLLVVVGGGGDDGDWTEIELSPAHEMVKAMTMMVTALEMEKPRGDASSSAAGIRRALLAEHWSHAGHDDFMNVVRVAAALGVVELAGDVVVLKSQRSEEPQQQQQQHTPPISPIDSAASARPSGGGGVLATNPEARKRQLGAKLRLWTVDFESRRGRAPGKADVDADADAAAWTRELEKFG